MAENEHSVQLDPEKCVLVMGPQMAAEALSLSEGVPAALSYAMLINIGIQKILDLDKDSNSTEKNRKHALMVNAYELEPAFAAHKIVESLRENNIYKEWLVELFGSLPSLHAMSSARQKQGGKVVEKLMSLQERGMLLVYTYYDTVLDSQMGTTPILLEDEEGVDNWASSRTRGLLHVHGVFSKPDSVAYDSVDYRQLVGETVGGRILKNICHGRSVIFAGFDGEFYDPFLPKFARTFLSQEHTPPLLLSTAPKVANLAGAFLNLKVPQLTQLDKLLVPQAPASYLGTSRDCVENKLTTTLLYGNKVSCLDAAELVKITSGVNVHQLTMRHERLYHHLLLYLDRDGLKELWKLIFAVSSPSKPGLHTGLLGVVLNDVITVWMDRGVAVQQEQHVSLALSSNVESSAGVREHSLHLNAPHSSQPPSLSTSVALIGSTWTTPIPATAISRPLPTASVSTASNRGGHPSPLVSSTSRTSLGTVTTRVPSSEAQMSLLRPVAPSHRPHNQVRRVKSEYLMYRDRLGKQSVMPNRNGILLHRESAPEFVQTSEGLVAYRSNSSSHRERSSVLIGQSRPAPPSHTHHQLQPSPLVKGGAHMEVKIECVDTKQPSNNMPFSGAPVSATPSNNGGPSHFKAEGLRPPDMSPVPKGKEFSEEKQKFIMEAQSWSKQVDSDLAKKMKVTTTAATSSSILFTPSSSSSMSRTYPLAFLGSHPQLNTAQPSLTSKFSPEEQEKFLKQHFEQIMQQQQLLSVAGMPSLPIPVPPAKSPVGGASLAQTTPSAPCAPPLRHSHSRQPSSTSLTAPLQAQPSSGAMASPKKTSPLSLLPPNPPVGSAPLSMLPFLPTSAAAAPSLLCNPSLPQFPMAAAMFNPVYQATLQKLVKNSPMPDPTLLQGLVDKVPVVLPNGQITLVPFGSSLQQSSGELSPTRDAAEEIEDKDEELEEEEEKEDVLKSPLAVGCKRMRSPGAADTRTAFRNVPPKRRRSSSLPDINQLLHISPHKKFHEEEKDGEPGKEENVEIREKKSNGITGAMGTSSLSGSPHPRQQAPPTMIHIPQDMKMSDPMLGFPTPPQSSPLRGGFSLSPVVLPSAQFHYHQSAQHSHQPMTPVTPGQEVAHNNDDLRELVEAGDLPTTLPPSPEGSSLPPFPAGRGPIQLWQFLLDLLLSPDKQHMIHWTGNGYEFCILLPEDIAKLWGARKNKPRMNYDKLSRGLRYYYNKGIMDKVQGKKLTFKYTCDVHNYIRSRNAQAHGASTPHVPLPGGEYRSGSSTPVLMQPLSDGGLDGDDVGDEGMVPVAGDQGKLYGGATNISGEMELAPPPVFQHAGLKKSSSEVFTESEGSRCDYQGLMNVVKGYSVLGVMEQDGRADSPARLHSGLCSEAV